ncbi:MAG: hypothetical protein V2I97_02430 [Desulfococcaceae bacterium]|jgi:flagellin-like hook-associated protein FlgL|nr:hypothetical protein [Desulfococcaceae bacterium]
MALSNVSLTEGMRNNLLGMQATARMMDTTSTRLGTGKKVNSALDDASAFFASQAHMQRANDLDYRKNGMGEAIQTIKAADAGIKGVTTLVEQMKGIVNASEGASATEKTANQATLDEIALQIDALIEDSVYKGTNLLNGVADLTVYFNEDGTNTLTVASTDVQAATLAVDTLDTTDSTTIAASLTTIQTALTTLRSASVQLSSNLGVITAREDFTSDMISTLQVGSDKLTLADLNEEGANMLMLQTRQQLSTSALSLSSQAAQSVLRLF